MKEIISILILYTHYKQFNKSKMDSKPTYEDLKSRINDLESKLENNQSELGTSDYNQDETSLQHEQEFKTLVDNAPYYF